VGLYIIVDAALLLLLRLSEALLLRLSEALAWNFSKWWVDGVCSCPAHWLQQWRGMRCMYSVWPQGMQLITPIEWFIRQLHGMMRAVSAKGAVVFHLCMAVQMFICALARGVGGVQ
jgi:hypothetical protein